MEIAWKWTIFLFGLLLLHLCNGYPIDLEYTAADGRTQLLTGLVAVLLTICSLVLLVGCLCCQRRNRFKQFRDNAVVASSGSDIDHGHVNPVANGEFTIFTPLSPPLFNNNIFLASDQIITSSLENHIYDGFDLSSWFNESEKDFPRIKLKYIKELGKGWFGKVVEGAAQDVEKDKQSWTPVVVRILDATSSQKEKLLFLQDAAIYRCGAHSNILLLIGKCLDTVPFLLLQEYCPQGDLKKYLRSNRNNAEGLLSSEYPLLWCCQLTSALNHLHKNKVAHPDLAARNCLLSMNLTLKLGDYGLGIYNYPDDYYQSSRGVPVRWCAPESLNCTQTTIQPKKASPESNVWSLGVTMWEICECGEQPYSMLSDDDVISKVLGPPHVRLERPSYSVLYTDYIFRLMQLCWTTNAESRATVTQIDLMLSDLLQVLRNTTNNVNNDCLLSVDDFDSRWQAFKPNYIVKTDHISDSVSVEIHDSDIIMKSLSPSLNNLLLENGPPVDCYIEDELKCKLTKRNSLIVSDASGSSDSEQDEYHKNTNSKSKQDKKEEKIITNPFSDVSFFQRMSSGSETEDENWRNKVERGAYTEKVRMKSRSVADLMVLTTVDYSESESETPLPSLDYRVNYKNVRYAPANNLENINITFGSEGNLLSVEDTFQEELKKLKEERRDSLLFVPDNNSQIISHNPEANVVNTSRLIEELNGTTEIKPANQVFNVFNVTITNYSPIHVKNKLNDIIFRDDFALCKSGQSVDVDMGCEQTQVLPTYKNQTYKNESCDSNLNDISVLSCEFDYFCNDVARNEKYPVVINNPEYNASDDSILQYIRMDNDTNLEEEKPKYEEVVNFSCKLIDEILDEALDEAKLFVKKESLERLSPDINVLRKDLDVSIKHDEFQVLGSEIFSCANLNNSIKNSAPNSDSCKSHESHLSNSINNNITQASCKLLSDNEIDKDIVYNKIQKCYNNTELSTPDNKENETIDIIQQSVDPVFQTCTTKDVEVSKKHTVVGILKKYESQSVENIEFGEPIPDEIGKTFESVKTSQLYQNNLNKQLSNQIESGSISELDPQCDIRPQYAPLNTVENEKHITNTDSQILNNYSKEYLNALTAKEIVSQEVEPSSKLQNEIFSLVEVDTEKQVFNKSEPVLLKDLKFNYNEPIGYESVKIDSKHNLLLDDSEFNEHKEKIKVEITSCVDDINSEANSDSNISTLNNYDPENKHIIVTFDISPNQEEVKPNTLTHSSLFTSTPFRKKELSLPLSHDNEYTSINLFSVKSENTEEFELEFPSLENQDFENKQLNYSLETWDNFLDKTLDQSKNLFDSFSSEPQSLLFVDNNINVKKAADGTVIINKEDLSKVVEEESDVTKSAPDTTFTIVGNEEKKNEEVNTTFVIPQTDLEVSNESWESGGGWFLHPQTSNEDPSGEMEIQASNTDSYVGFGIDEEIMSAIRNELLTKLPHAQGTASDRVKDEDEWDCGERSEVFLKYNVYNTPLSPIPEESFIEESSGSNTPKPEIENVDSDWSEHCEVEVFPLDTESISAHTHESPYRGHLYRHTPSQDSCCSNDTLFNLEDLICTTTESGKDFDLPLNNVNELLTNINEKDISCKINLNQTYSLGAGMVENQEEISEESTLSNQTKVGSSHSVDILSPPDTRTTLITIDNFLLKEKKHSSDLLQRTDGIIQNDVKKGNLPFLVTQAVPLPSPEDNPWKQLPASLLNYEKVIAQTSSTLSLENAPVPEYVDIVVKNEDNYNDKSEEKENIAASILENNINNYDDYVNIVNRQNAKNMLEYENLNKINDYSKIFVPNEEYNNSADENVYGVLTDIRFNGPSDSQLMSTSFSESNNCDEQEWDSGSDTRSSSSGEFIWKEGEHEESLKALRAAPQEMVEDIKPMESITEDFIEESDISSTFSDDDSEIPEFVPSAWDQFALPGKSALRSPENTLKNKEKKSKGVWFKKQKYHCIYEYPRESESPILQSNDLWKPQTPNDYKIFTDWEFDGETYIPSSDDIESTVDTVQKSVAQRNIYQLTSVTDFMPNGPALDDEFFISSSTQPFEIPSSQFFPGHNNWMENATPDSGIDDVIAPNNTVHDNGFFKTIRSVPKLKQLASDAINKKKHTSQSKDMMGGLRHTKNKLKLDLPPSPNAFTADKLFMIEAPNLEPAVREKPTFTTFGKSRFLVQHVDTPTDESKCKNVSFEALPYKPLFENRNKQDIEKENYNNKKLQIEKSIEENDATDMCKLKIEIVRGEASLLDSADEDSGIESSTLERKLSTAKLL